MEGSDPLAVAKKTRSRRSRRTADMAIDAALSASPPAPPAKKTPRRRSRRTASVTTPASRPTPAPPLSPYISIDARAGTFATLLQRPIDQPHVAVEEHRERAPRPAVEIETVLPEQMDPHLVSLLTPTGLEAERYRLLRYMIEKMHQDNATLRLIAVSSPAPGDGKTLTAINLAGALAQSGASRVLLVDADLRRPTLSATLGISAASQGLVGALQGLDLRVEDIVQRYTTFNLFLLSSGGRHLAPYELLRSPRFGALLQEMRRQYDYVIVDTPPLVPFSDCQLIGEQVDGFLLVIGAHKTPRALVAEALKVMNPEKLLGLVFNGDDSSRAKYYAASYSAYAAPTNGARASWLARLAQRASSFFRARVSKGSTESPAQGQYL